MNILTYYKTKIFNDKSHNYYYGDDLNLYPDEIIILEYI